MDAAVPRIDVFGVVLVLVLVAGACSAGSPSGPADEPAASAMPTAVAEAPEPDPTPFSESAEVLQVLESRGCGATTTSGAAQEDDLLSVRGAREVAPGGTVEFAWDVDSDVEAGGRTLVECWTGSDWVEAWGVTNAYAQAPREPGYVLDLDLFITPLQPINRTEGAIAVPPGTPPGTYRFVAQLTICDSPDGDCRIAPHRGRASFEVVAP